MYIYILTSFIFLGSRCCIEKDSNMPYIIISTMIRTESGPTIVGDEWSDPELMNYLKAKLSQEYGNNFKEYRSPDPPRVILNKLEKKGYHVVSMAGAGQTCLWTCYGKE
ncbi:GTP cyclohydrolase 1 feedback regulatory protein-like [Xenia sp. Carnegie-2017]|uniref:GTP cyclohydrolase 1 feedback regulatory protein-like n=1 Tax=Xenia sp. Carnegie-2017 TaxID=2897299 RepID=UPI001F03E012|nr:GTP cyclohydrolase 1 feedback regulatory protein-like [Xenia sp. Carnegie-2017]